MLGGLITIAGGILAASGFIIKRSPNAQSLIVKIAPYQGWIRMLMFVWGEWETYAQRPRHLAARLAPHLVRVPDSLGRRRPPRQLPPRLRSHHALAIVMGALYIVFAA